MTPINDSLKRVMALVTLRHVVGIIVFVGIVAPTAIMLGIDLNFSVILFLLVAFIAKGLSEEAENYVRFRARRSVRRCASEDHPTSV